MTRIWPATRRRTARPRAGGRWLCADTLIAGAAAGVAFSTHYYCIFLALPLAWAIVLRTRAGGAGAVVRHLARRGAASAVVFFALSPFLLVEPMTALRDITANRADRGRPGGRGGRVRAGRALCRTCSGATRWACRSYCSGARPARCGCWWSTGGAPSCCWRFPLPFLLFIANTAPASRYLNPVLPFVALFAGWALARAVAARCTAAPACSGLPLVVGAAARRRDGQHPEPTGSSGRTTPARWRSRYIESHIAAGHRHPDPAVLGAADHVTAGAGGGADASPRQLPRPPRPSSSSSWRSSRTRRRPTG